MLQLDVTLSWLLTNFANLIFFLWIKPNIDINQILSAIPTHNVIKNNVQLSGVNLII